jgi:hypothetical protein
VILQEFTGATSYTEVGAGGADGGTSETYSILTIPSSPLPAPTEENILAIAGSAHRGSISNLDFSGLGGEVLNSITSINGGTAYDYKAGPATVLQTDADWDTNRVSNGLLVLFACE